MTTTDSKTLYGFVLQQMAAESYFEGLQLTDKGQITDALKRGANRLGYQDGPSDLNQGYRGYTRMTEAMADEFLSKYSIVHQWSDNPTPTGSRPAEEGIEGKPKLNTDILANTGFSATLIQDKTTGEFTLAMRSTEFRDWSKGGDGERDTYGADKASLAITGFALAQLDAMERYYRWLKDNGKLPPGAKLNVTGYSLGGHLATVFTEIHQTEMNGGQTVTFNGAGRGTLSGGPSKLTEMILYYRSVLADPTYAPARGGLPDPIRDAARGKTGPLDAKSVYDDPRFTWAVAATAYMYGLSTLPLSDETRKGTSADSLITQVFGWETVNNINVTANSGIHGPALRVGIESQPALEGLTGGFVIPNGDFGNGHSITLIADSLALQRALEKLDTSYTLKKFIDLLPSTTNRTTSNGVNANYEVDALENVLDALRRFVLGPTVAKTEFKEGAGGFGDITKREGYYANLQALTDSSAFKALAGKVVIRPSGGDLQAKARTDFGALAALKTLSPIWITGNGTDDAPLDALWGSSPWASDYALWQADKNLPPSQRGFSKENFTDQWLTDRAALLAAISRYNIANRSDKTISSAGAPLDAKNVYSDITTDTTLTVANSGSLPSRYIKFGGSDNDALLGGPMDDHLYGASGNDTLNGQGGNDYLEGGTGNDTYTFNAGDGKDVIVDTDGKGSLTYASQTLTGGQYDVASGGWTQKLGSGETLVYKLLASSASASGKQLTIAKKGDSDNTITIHNFDLTKAQGNEGYLGIKLDPTSKLALTEKLPANFWSQAGATLEQLAGKAATLVEQGAKAFMFYLSAPAKPGDTITLKLSGATDKFKAILGDDTVPANGAVITLMDGQTEVAFSLVEDGSLSSDINAQLSATYTSADTQTGQSPSTSNTWALTVKDAGDPTHTYLGDQHGPVNAAGAYDWSHTSWAADGTLTGGVAEANFADVIFGSEGIDKISGLGGNDALSGGDGNDQIDGGDGDDLIGGGAGSDVIQGGAGNDYILSSATLGVQPRSKTTDTWTPPKGTTIVTQGPTWGVYKDAKGDIWWEGTNAPTGSDPDTIDGGAGNDWVIASAGDDRVQGGTGDDVLDGMGGNDVLEGGDGKDTIHGDGIIETGYMNSLAAPKHGADFIDGGLGDDTLTGDGGSDMLYGGADNDTLYGDSGGNTASADYVALAYHGNDTLDGEDGDDYLEGGGKDDTLYGGAGNDKLWGDTTAANVASAADAALRVTSAMRKRRAQRPCAKRIQVSAITTIATHPGNFRANCRFVLETAQRGCRRAAPVRRTGVHG